MKTVVYHNPILKGFRPDPSICFVNNDCYLVNSTFEYFPGVPIFHSKDLINWNQLGACLSHESQINLKNIRPSGGIYAPTIRYRDGTFYMITTNVSHKGNFIVSTNDISGEWSEPQWIDHKGIDPSLFFDDDGKVYYCGTGEDENEKPGIILFEINPKSGQILSDKQIISYGFTNKCPEGPHLYKFNNWYYLMIAEGGTEYGHMETIFRSKNITGPYESCPFNPILSNRNEMNNQIQCCGHADIAEDANGNWWMVCLGVRILPNGTFLHNLGRETFLAPVTWTEDGWPLIGADGTIKEIMEGPIPQGKLKEPSDDFEDDFQASKFAQEWTFVRNPDLSQYIVGNGKLKIKGSIETLDDCAPSFIGIRQKEFEMVAKVTLSADLLVKSAKSGMTVYYSKDNHYDFYLRRESGKLYAVLSKKIMDLEAITGQTCLGDVNGTVTLKIQTGVLDYTFSVIHDNCEVIVGTGCTAGMCTEGTKTMTFTGTFIGLFANNTVAQFESFSLKPLE